MKFSKDEFTNVQQDEITTNHSWMENYYSILRGGVITNVSIAVDEGHSESAFLNLEIQLMNGKKYQCELVSVDDMDRPGLLVGLPTDKIKGAGNE